MNEITIHGNLTADPVLREGQSGKPFATFTVAVNRSYYAADRGTRVDLPAVFHSVIAFNQLADNAAQTLAKALLFSVALSTNEIERLRQDCNRSFGVGPSERTYPKITSLRDLRNSSNLDWSMLGMIEHAIRAQQEEPSQPS